MSGFGAYTITKPFTDYLYPYNSPPAYDKDAQLFITNAGITDLVQQSAINKLVIDLKLNTLWDKFIAIYPFVGGTATTHKFNLKNPYDINNAYRLSFQGGWTHSLTGATPNGTNGYADTFLNPLTQSLSINSIHLAYYRRTTQGVSGALVSSISGTTTLIRLNLAPNYDTTNNNITEILSTNAQQSTASISTLGLILGNRIIGSEFKLFINSSLNQTVSRTSTAQPNNNIYIGAVNYIGPTGYSNNQCAFASIGTGFTDDEAKIFYSIVQNYQTTLGRAV